VTAVLDRCVRLYGCWKQVGELFAKPCGLDELAKLTVPFRDREPSRRRALPTSPSPSPVASLPSPPQGGEPGAQRRFTRH